MKRKTSLVYITCFIVILGSFAFACYFINQQKQKNYKDQREFYLQQTENYTPEEVVFAYVDAVKEDNKPLASALNISQSGLFEKDAGTGTYINKIYSLERLESEEAYLNKHNEYYDCVVFNANVETISWHSGRINSNDILIIRLVKITVDDSWKILYIATI